MASVAPVSVMILTFNEEVNVEHCLHSVQDWAGEIFVVDSGSTDRTVEICRQYTEHVISHAWPGNHGKQVNWALDNLPFAYPWILQLDADEFVTPELAEE